MKVGGRSLRPIRALPGEAAVMVIDQRALPFELKEVRLHTPDQVFDAIRQMWVRGAPLIGATAAYGLAMQATRDASDAALKATAVHLQSARPTAVNLAWAVQRVLHRVLAQPIHLRAATAWAAWWRKPRRRSSTGCRRARSGRPQSIRARL